MFLSHLQTHRPWNRFWLSCKNTHQFAHSISLPHKVWVGNKNTNIYMNFYMAEEGAGNGSGSMAAAFPLPVKAEKL